MKEKIDFKKINEELKEVNPKLFLQWSLEDYSEDDLEEYGISDIRDTGHLTLNLWEKEGVMSYRLKSYFKLGRMFMFTESEKKSMKMLGLTDKDISQICIRLNK